MAIMNFETTIQEGRFLKRYKRFFADIEIPDGGVFVAHVPNTGSLKGCIENPALCRFTVSDNPERKLKHTLQMIKLPTTWVGINTGLPPLLVREAWKAQRLQHWSHFDCAQWEVKISEESRIDLVLWNSQQSYPGHEKLALAHCLQSNKKLHFVEIKNVTMSAGGHAVFPDCVSMRARKHLRELTKIMDRGHTAEILFVVQRQDCTRFRAAHECDPEYAQLLRQAHQSGVKITAVGCEFGKNSITLRNEEMEVDL